MKEIKIKTNHSVSFVWDKETVVRILQEAQPGNSTVVKVTEDGKEYSEDNLKWVIRNTEGWANFLASMKAWLETIGAGERRKRKVLRDDANLEALPAEPLSGAKPWSVCSGKVCLFGGWMLARTEDGNLSSNQNTPGLSCTQSQRLKRPEVLLPKEVFTSYESFTV